ncbi:HEAT repeat domain-containing protein [Candidatus Uabimicrobium amorphum]|uniref:HEAT repeat domain-containing protein n=1 Tax=Uabimicrobium amorphum TaxID=2596890 RepID=A0A5S9F637_UABAM|nr:hypothetical protein [Candidatus Uabimicrobium amorphum]BBM87272.1 hypothetical protein UABAM_05675 [Candidatus Uabimicrobium amorphum]
MLEKWTAKLTSYDENVREQAVKELKELGASAFDDVAKLLEHEVAKWEVVRLLPVLSPPKAIPFLLKVVNHNREICSREHEHAKKYFRICAIEQFGKLGEGATKEILTLFAQHKVEECLGYFIHPQSPHLHHEVVDAVIKSLKQISTPRALKFIKDWENK